MKCRHCYNKLDHIFLDLGTAPPSNAYLSNMDLSKPEIYYPLKLYVCEECFLVQTEDYSSANELFNSNYAYFSSVSSGWLEHARLYSLMIKDRLNLNKESFVIEVASNDGYLLKNFIEMQIPCLGIEPTKSTADAAEQLGIPVYREFFGNGLGKKLSREGKQADLIIGNNVYAHVPDINDFTQGLKQSLKPNGTITLEFPHLMQLIQHNQFDTVYHEHYSYLSLVTVCQIFNNVGLRVFDIEELPTHGGSLRVYGCHKEDIRDEQESVKRLIKLEHEHKLFEIETYLCFQERAIQIKNNLLELLIKIKKSGKSVVAYGAAAKGNTMLNYAGIKTDLISYVCDAAPSKQGKYLPGSRIPIMSPKEIARKKPDWILILPWNIAEEVMQQIDYIEKWKGKFITAIPEIKIYD